MEAVESGQEAELRDLRRSNTWRPIRGIVENGDLCRRVSDRIGTAPILFAYPDSAMEAVVHLEQIAELRRLTGTSGDQPVDPRRTLLAS